MKEVITQRDELLDKDSHYKDWEFEKYINEAKKDVEGK